VEERTTVIGRLGWTAVGLLAGLGLAALASIGVFLLVVALGLAALLGSRNVDGILWMPLGAGVAFAAIGFVALPWRACDGTSHVEVPAGSREAVSSSCGGIHPAAWFVIAAVLAAVSIGAATREVLARDA
jgi:hypothetical protein